MNQGYILTDQIKKGKRKQVLFEKDQSKSVKVKIYLMVLRANTTAPGGFRGIQTPLPTLLLIKLKIP